MKLTLRPKALILLLLILATPVISLSYAQNNKQSLQSLYEMVYVEGGTFEMGSNNANAYSNESPIHSVTVGSFYMGKYEVTQKQWQNITKRENPSHFKTDKNPVEQVSWFDCIELCNMLSRKAGLDECYEIDGEEVRLNMDRNGYRLPTEAEWEFASRGGTKSEEYQYNIMAKQRLLEAQQNAKNKESEYSAVETEWELASRSRNDMGVQTQDVDSKSAPQIDVKSLAHEYSGSNVADDVAWHDGNSEKKTHEIGRLKPNELGIYDMSGNIWEWCWDWYGHYSPAAQDNPTGIESGSHRVGRGGCAFTNAGYCTSTSRLIINPSSSFYSVGVRLVRRP